MNNNKLGISNNPIRERQREFRKKRYLERLAEEQEANLEVRDYINNLDEYVENEPDPINTNTSI